MQHTAFLLHIPQERMSLRIHRDQSLVLLAKAHSICRSKVCFALGSL